MISDLKVRCCRHSIPARQLASCAVFLPALTLMQCMSSSRCVVLSILQLMHCIKHQLNDYCKMLYKVQTMLSRNVCLSIHFICHTPVWCQWPNTLLKLLPGNHSIWLFLGLNHFLKLQHGHSAHCSRRLKCRWHGDVCRLTLSHPLLPYGILWVQL